MANPCVLKVEVARARLTALGMTQTAIAERCGVELRTMQRWFAGGRASLEDAERMAFALGMGTADVFDGLRDDEPSPVGRIRSAIRLLGMREGTIANAFRLTLEHFDFVERCVAFSSHPLRGFVHREPMSSADHHAFAVLRITTPDRAPTRIALTTQVGRRFRYEFGHIQVNDHEVLLEEHFHTRSARASRAPDGSFELWTWVPTEMLELILIADRDIRVARKPGPGSQLFDLNEPATRHAVCSRPAPMHLRAAGLPSVFDRVAGAREGRIDLSMP